MSYELDYFTEFLENPSAPTLGEFYRMLKLWCEYIAEHKGDFNYLKDEEWKEIRERLIAEFPIRQKIKAEVDAEWDYIGRHVDFISELNDDEALDIMKRQMILLKNYQDYFNISDEELASGQETFAKFEDSLQKSLIADENLRISEQNLDKSLANLDAAMLKAQEKTGKIPQIHFYKDIKRHLGN